MRDIGKSPADEVPNEVVCAVVLLSAKNEALLQLRDEKPGLTAAGLWVFPGGHAEADEDLFDCAIREFLEETAYRCSNARWLLSTDDVFLKTAPTRLHVFWDRYEDGREYECREGQDLQFVERNRATEIAMPDFLLAIWDLAILASRSHQQRSRAKINSDLVSMPNVEEA